jgi:hypothetical protein
MKATESEIISAMRTFGGSFVERLAEAFQFADDVNRARLRVAFPEVWSQYEELATMRKRNAAHAG